MNQPDEYSELAAEVAAGLRELVNNELRQTRPIACEESKGQQDVVTEADRRIESQTSTLLRRLRPSSVVRGEEGAGASATHGQEEWILDPIDGTINFTRGCGSYTSVVSLLISGLPQLAVVYDPMGGLMTTAVRGRGCWARSASLEVAGSPERLAVVGRPFARTLHSIMITPKLSPAARRASLEYASLTLDRTLGFRVLVSQAFEATRLAAGGLDVVISLQSSGGWSRDASRLVCEEAGGIYRTVVNMRGPEQGFLLVSDAETLGSVSDLVHDVGYEVA
jgi:myo-inositol-1(or 4)-monophosphatase